MPIRTLLRLSPQTSSPGPYFPRLKIRARAADDDLVRRALRRLVPLALAAVALVGLPPAAGTAAAPTPTAADLPALQAELERVTSRATTLAAELETAAARQGGLRVELDRLAEEQERARARVDARARQAFYAVRGDDPLARLVGGLAAPDLRALADAELARRGAAAALRTETALADAVGAHATATRALQAQAQAHRAQLTAQAEQALTAQEAARAVLAQAERALAEQEARAAEGRRQAELAAARTALTVSRNRLDGASAVVTKALTPAQTRRSQNAAVREAPIVALVETAGAGYPQGYRPTGQVLRGVASWYGPGFVGNPTASGAPYDPERLTCAHKTLPLGTVVRVSRGPLVISCLINDRGPYVGARIIDLSRAGSRALGFDGVADVAVEVLAPAR